MEARGENNPFDLGNDLAYQHWREWKLDNYPISINEISVVIDNLNEILPEEVSQIVKVVGKTNMAIYSCRSGAAVDDKRTARALGQAVGLEHLDGNLCADADGISSIQVMTDRDSRHQGYIPYTPRPINWHTDGYYNDTEHRIRGMLLHCARPAASGGENGLLDPEIAYIHLRDEDPALAAALMQSDAMTIPANIEHGVEIRPARTGPVFSVDEATGRLHMRYTARTRSIVWKQDGRTEAANDFLKDLLNSDLAYIYRIRLQAGQGIVCNNVLHNRAAFTDGDGPDERRLVYRARYYDRVQESPER